jgi:hypothetical protein
MKFTFIKKVSLALICAAVVLVSWTRNSASDIKHLTEEEIFNGLVFMKGKLVGMVPELQEAATIQAKLGASSNEKQGLNKLQSEILQRIKTKHPGYLTQFKQVITSGNQYAIKAEMEKVRNMTSDAMGDILGIELGDLASKREAIQKLLGDKMQQLKELSRKFQTGDMTEAQFKSASVTLLEDKKQGLAEIFPQANGISIGNMSSTGNGTCVAINVAVYVNIYGAINVAAAVNIYAAVNVFTAVNFWFGGCGGGGGGGFYLYNYELQSLNGERMVNSIANRLKQ